MTVTTADPEVGQLVRVRGHQWVVWRLNHCSSGSYPSPVSSLTRSRSPESNAARRAVVARVVRGGEQVLGGQHPVHGGLRDVHQAEPGAAVGQLARCSATACSVTVARNRSISAFAAASAASTGAWPGRPGTDAANASSATCLVTRHAVTTVERSTPYRSAGSRCVACPVTIDIHNPYFSLGDSRRRGFPPDTDGKN